MQNYTIVHSNKKHTIIRQNNIIILAFTVTYVNYCCYKHFSLMLLCVILGKVDKHTSVSAQVYKRGKMCVLPTIQPEPVTVTCTPLLPPPCSLSPFHSVKTDVRTDRPSLHPSAKEEDAVLTLPPCLHLSKKPKQKYQDRPNNVSSLGSQHPHPPRAKAQFSSPTGVQQRWVTTRLRMGMASPQTCVGDGICCSYLN